MVQSLTEIDFWRNIMFHQPQNTFGDKIYNAFIYDDVEYTEHFHKSYELIYCMGDTAVINIDGSAHTIQKGELMLIFPYKRHSFIVHNPKNRIWVGVFSGDNISEFDKRYSGKEPKNPIFKLDSKLNSLLLDNFFCKNNIDIFSLKGYLYLIMGEFVNKTSFVPKVAKEKEDIILKVIDYIEKNFKNDISLQTASKALGYNHQYLSRMFKRTMNIGFSALVNQYRFNYASNLLQNKNVTVVEACTKSGFGSLRNFYRVYKSMTGSTPCEALLAKFNVV